MASFSRRPISVTCYICGRGYGTASLAIHVPQCQSKFVAEQEKLPKHLRRPLPEAPAVIGGGGSGSAVDADKWNEAAFKSYTEHGLVSCEHCGRRFASDRLAIHHRSCTADNPARRVGEKQPGGGGGRMLPRDEDDEGGAEAAAFAATAPLPSPSVRPGTSSAATAGASRPASVAAGAARPTTAAGLSATMGALPPSVGARSGGGGGGGGGGSATTPLRPATATLSAPMPPLRPATPQQAAAQQLRASPAPGTGIPQASLPAALAAAAEAAATGVVRRASVAGSTASVAIGDGSLIEALLDIQADIDDLRLEVHARLEGISGRVAALIAHHGGGAQ